MPVRKLVLSLAVLMLASASLALAQGTYTQIDYPGATSTWCWGVNANGDISGFYVAPAGEGGFVLSNGAFTFIPATALVGINDNAQVIGYTGELPFVYDITSQQSTYLKYPGSKQTFVSGINDTGIVVGYYKVGGDLIEGFEWANGTYTEIAFPGATKSHVYGINATGEVIGTFTTKGHGAVFLNSDGEYWRESITGAPNAAPYGINDFRTVVGTYSPDGTYEAGFVYQRSILTVLSLGGSTSTYATGINDAGEVTGYFYDVNAKVYHGFIWTPPAAAEKK